MNAVTSGAPFSGPASVVARAERGERVASEQTARIAGGLIERLVSPSKPLEDMTLSCFPEHVKLLSETLRRIGFAFTRKTVKQSLGDDEYAFNLVANNGIRRVLLWIPNEILTNPGGKEAGLFKYVIFLILHDFNWKIALYIVRDKEADPAYETWLKNLQGKTHCPAEFIPLSHLENLKKRGQEAQEAFFKAKLELDVPPDPYAVIRNQIQRIEKTLRKMKKVGIDDSLEVLSEQAVSIIHDLAVQMGTLREIADLEQPEALLPPDARDAHKRARRAILDTISIYRKDVLPSERHQESGPQDILRSNALQEEARVHTHQRRDPRHRLGSRKP